MREKNLEIQVVNFEEEFNLFWNMHHEYMNRDIFPNDKLSLEITEKEGEWFFSSEYKKHMYKLFLRDIDKAYPVLFKKEKEVVGFCMYCTYHSEDGKCFIIDYCILPEFRNDNLGTSFFNKVKEIEVSKGAKYFELNVSNKRNMNFWLKQGFDFNGIDDYGSVKLTTKKDDILLINVDENNCTELTSLKLSEEQLKYVASPIGILARGYIYRNSNARVFGIQKEKRIIGMLMVRDIDEEPECYELQSAQFYINKGSIDILGNNFHSRLFEPVPIKMMGQDIVMTDEEKDGLDWEAYSINVHDCKERGITSALDSVRCIVPNEVFQLKWNKYCDDLHNKLSYQRNSCDYSALPYWK